MVEQPERALRFWFLFISGFTIFLVCAPVLIGYMEGQIHTLRSVPGYFLECRSGWNPIDWYTLDELFIPVDDFRRYLAVGCPPTEARNIPPPEFISNPIFRAIQRKLDYGFFLGYRAGVDHAIGMVIPTWNWAFKGHAWFRKSFVAMLVVIGAWFLAFVGVHLFKLAVSRKY